MKTTPNNLLIPLTPVESSQIHASGHDPVSNTMRVQFRAKEGPGSTYDYANVDAEKYAAFMAAESKGRFHRDELKMKPDVHPYSRIADPPAPAEEA